jgi:predicted dehydrogenase
MMKRHIGFALIGTGGIAQSYEAAFKGYSHGGLMAVCDVNYGAAEMFAARVGCEAYGSIGELLENCAVDAALVCTPPATHEPISTELLNHKIHVLCEKPLSTTVESASRMLECARANNVVLTMASKFRYVSDIRMAKALVDVRAIGDLVFVENAFTSRIDMSKRWNSDPAVSGGGVLIDNGTHAVDILRYFLGHLNDVQVVEGRRIQGLPVEDTVRVFVRNDDGVMGTADLSWTIDKEMSTYLRLYGSEGTVLIGWQESKYRRSGESEWTKFGRGYDKVQAFRSQIANFCEAICGEADLLITPGDSLASVETISAAYAALERSRWESIGSQFGDLFRVPEQTQLEAS